MFNIFKRFRRKLLEAGALNKYLAYAIGEILLVSIGILIALQVNNWNEIRKKEKLGIELSSMLYDEMEATHHHGSGVVRHLDKQIKYIDLILTQGNRLNVDSLLLSSKEDWGVKRFTFTGFIFFFTIYYDPNTEVFDASLSDGSIKNIQDLEFLPLLATIYTKTGERINDLYDREVASNENLALYISSTYSRYFEDHSNIIDGNWDDATVKKLLEATMNDGALRFRLQQKNTNLKSKRDLLQHFIVKPIEDYMAERAIMPE